MVKDIKKINGYKHSVVIHFIPFLDYLIQEFGKENVHPLWFKERRNTESVLIYSVKDPVNGIVCIEAMYQGWRQRFSVEINEDTIEKLVEFSKKDGIYR